MNTIIVELVDLALALDEQADLLMQEQKTHAKARRLRARSLGLTMRLLERPTDSIYEAMRECFDAHDVRGREVASAEMYVISDLFRCPVTRATVWKEIGS